MGTVRQTPSSSQNVNPTDHPIPQGLSDRRVDGPLAVISSAPVTMPEHVRTESGLLLLISIEIVSAIIQLSGDRKSTRLNSSHVESSYAVLCLKKKTILYQHTLDIIT